MVCIPDTASDLIEAVLEAEKNMDRTITVLSFGNVDGCPNILGLVHCVDESKAPKEVEFDKDEIKKDCIVVFWTSGTTGSS